MYLAGMSYVVLVLTIYKAVAKPVATCQLLGRIVCLRGGQGNVLILTKEALSFYWPQLSVIPKVAEVAKDDTGFSMWHITFSMEIHIDLTVSFESKEYLALAPALHHSHSPGRRRGV